MFKIGRIYSCLDMTIVAGLLSNIEHHLLWPGLLLSSMNPTILTTHEKCSITVLLTRMNILDPVDRLDHRPSLHCDKAGFCTATRQS